MVRRLFLVALLVCMRPLAAQAPEYRNPVLPGDHPDPSIIRVGGEFWATATTSQWAPIFPLLRSTDLVAWTREGAVFDQPPAWSSGSYWAPEIAEHKGTYFVYYTARRKNGPLCVAVATAARPAGPWTDHGPLVCQEVGSIDAAPVTEVQQAENTVNVALEITEGRQAFIHRVEITGNIRTRDKVIRRELAVVPGLAAVAPRVVMARAVAGEGSKEKGPAPRGTGPGVNAAAASPTPARPPRPGR